MFREFFNLLQPVLLCELFNRFPKIVTPVKTGVQKIFIIHWMPAFAGMTAKRH